MNTRHASEIWGTHTYFWEEIDITNSNTPTHICTQQSGRDGAGIRERARQSRSEPERTRGPLHKFCVLDKAAK